ncbi:MAG: trehalose-phosphatase [Rubrivivax sp.]
MQHLFTPQGEAALAALLRRRPLFGFDFDGTLAPIVAEPAAARIPPSVTGRLRLLAELAPVAVISGRAIDDLRQRLGFEPRHVVGSHGAEDPLHAPEATAGEHAAARDPLREHLRAPANWPPPASTSKTNGSRSRCTTGAPGGAGAGALAARTPAA